MPHENVSGMDVRLKTNHMTCHFDKIRFMTDNMYSVAGLFYFLNMFESNIRILGLW